MQVVVDLESLVGIGAFAVVGDGFRGGVELELLDGALHEADTPAEEARISVSSVSMLVVWVANCVVSKRLDVGLPLVVC